MTSFGPILSILLMDRRCVIGYAYHWLNGGAGLPTSTRLAMAAITGGRYGCASARCNR
jgi:hypothetical protein